MSNIKLLRGEIWYANLDPSIGHEQGNSRPCLIISNNKFNSSLAGLVVILPITSRKKNIISHVNIIPPEGGLNISSFIMCDQPRTISKERLIGCTKGQIYEQTLSRVEMHLKQLLDICIDHSLLFS